jgi:hypothetical protein
MRNASGRSVGIAVIAAALLAGTGRAGESGPSGDPHEPVPDPWDQEVTAVTVLCDDPFSCPPIRKVQPNDDAGNPDPGRIALPPTAELALPDARILAGHRGAPFQDPRPLTAVSDGKGGWSVADAGGLPLSPGAEIAYFGGSAFGELRVLAESSPGASLADPALDGQPQAIVLAAPIGVEVLRTTALGVYYDGARWWAFDESGAKLRAGQRIVFLDAGARGGRATRHAQNGYAGVGLVLDDPRLNGRPDAPLVAQHAFKDVRNPSPLAVWYDHGLARWIVYNSDGSPFPLGESVHYIVGS